MERVVVLLKVLCHDEITTSTRLDLAAIIVRQSERGLEYEMEGIHDTRGLRLSNTD